MKPLAVLLIAASLAGCASSGAYRASQIAFSASAVADIHSTRLALANGAHEANPLMPSGLWPSIAVKAAWSVPMLLLTNHVSKSNRVAATLINSAVAGVWAVVAANNYRLGAK